MKNLILGKYTNGNYDVVIFSDGTKIRRTEANKFVPAFPENADVKITDRCSQGCPFCYEGCTRGGRHAALVNPDGTFAQKWMDTLHPYTELAINGNDLDHPQLEEFLLKMQAKHIVVNVTVNQNQFMKNVKWLRYLTSVKMIYGVGVSLVNADDQDFIREFKTFDNAVLHTIAGILTLEQLQKFSDAGVKILILGYKVLGRGKDYIKKHLPDIEKNIFDLKDNLGWIVRHFKVLSFDNLAIEQLDVKKVLFTGREKEWEEFYMGDDGNFTLYIDAVGQKFAKNSRMEEEERFECGDLTMEEMFDTIRKEYGII